MKSVIIVQARTGSSRFPNKVMREINGIPIIELLLKRLTQSKKAQKIVVATTKEKKDVNQFLETSLSSNSFSRLN